MARDQHEQKTDLENPKDRVCWREMLYGALSGQFSYDQQIELLRDHLGRAR
ncbi:MAG: hypothetical protein OXC60_16925 [Litoreibacter sp.]|nr:hypothetical protein [Litoreibacter sp.]